MCETIITICYEEVLKGIKELLKLPGYLIYQLDNDVKTLEDEIGKLKNKRQEIITAVGSREWTGYVIKDDVIAWIETSKSMVITAEEFVTTPLLGDWNFICRYLRAKSLSNDLKRKMREGDFQGMSYPAPYPQLAGGFTEIGSRRNYLPVLKAALRFGKELVIGVHGDEGAGKTTLVEKLARDMETDGTFQHVVVIKKGGDRVVIKKLGGADKVLIIFDPLEKMIPLDSIGIPWTDSHHYTTCRIVVVSRNPDVCTDMGAKMKLKVEPLARGEAWTLFTTLANRRRPPLSDYGELTKVGVKEPKLRISSRDGTWLPGQIKAYIEAIHLMVEDVRNPNLSLMIPAVSLVNIEHEENRECWEWSSKMEAKLIQVRFLQIEGRARGDWLKPNYDYGAYFVYKLMTLPAAEGFHTNTVKCTVGFYNEDQKPKLCTLDPHSRAHSETRPTRREDGWLEIEMGTFRNHDYNPDAPIRLFVRDENTEVQKTGLIVRGIQLRQLRKK